ncbi:MAG: U32 family peptidase [Turicibacter sp.]|nr:U32 family peptidase [Turicibacter sp.]
MRKFKGRELELLAPVGTFSDFEAVITSSCDAVYLGGKAFNMRNHKKNHNFSNEELQKAVRRAHELGKKVYVTLNSMLNDAEIRELIPFLQFLGSIRPDGVIVADMGVVESINELGLSIDIHLSVMANVHNLDMVMAAKDMGATRVVLSREMSLETASALVAACPQMEYEYFMHGDMCSAHGAQCFLSGTLFGKSSNRGTCMKPCRWKFENGGHLLAVKDMSMYRHLPELLNSGINSFKIEGRMRDALYLVDIINAYGEAIDRYLKNPGGYLVEGSQAKKLWEHRVRDFSTAYSYKIPGQQFIAASGEREPRVFSLPVQESPISKVELDRIKQKLQGGGNADRPLLSICVNDPGSCLAAIKNGADAVYLNGETFHPQRPWELDFIKQAVKTGTKIYYRLPRMLSKRQSDELEDFTLKLKGLGIAGFLISNFGQALRFRNLGLEVIGDYGLNVYNKKSVSFYESLGLKRMMFSIEASAASLKEALAKTNSPLEILVHGAPTLMYMDHCLLAAGHNLTSQDWCHEYCREEIAPIIDGRGNGRRLRADRYCKNHLLPGADLALLPVVGELSALGAKALFIEARHEGAEVVGQLTRWYRKAIDGQLNPQQAWMNLIEATEGNPKTYSFLGFSSGI